MTWCQIVKQQLCFTLEPLIPALDNLRWFALEYNLSLGNLSHTYFFRRLDRQHKNFPIPRHVSSNWLYIEIA